MTRFIRKNFFTFLLYILFFFLGFCVRTVIKDISFFTLDKNVSVGDIANFLLAVVVAFLIPLSLSPILENKRSIKDFLIDEIKDCINFLTSIKELIDKLAIENNTTSEERLKVNSMISRDLSMKLGSLNTQLGISFDGDSKCLNAEINQKYKEYWEDTTGGELMAESFKFDIRFRNSHDKSYAKLEACLKKAIHEVNNY